MSHKPSPTLRHGGWVECKRGGGLGLYNLSKCFVLHPQHLDDGFSLSDSRKESCSDPRSSRRRMQITRSTSQSLCVCMRVYIMCAHLTQDLLNISGADIKLQNLLSVDPNVSKESSIVECQVLNFGL